MKSSTISANFSFSHPYIMTSDTLQIEVHALVPELLGACTCTRSTWYGSQKVAATFTGACTLMRGNRIFNFLFCSKICIIFFVFGEYASQGIFITFKSEPLFIPTSRTPFIPDLRVLVLFFHSEWPNFTGTPRRKTLHKKYCPTPNPIL